MKCNLCHLGFQHGKTVYLFPRGDGTPEYYHPPCFGQTTQGRMGYPAKEVFEYREQLELFS